MQNAINNTITIKGYIACLGLWNEGIDRGRWIDFPISSDEFNEILSDIGCDDEHEEYFSLIGKAQLILASTPHLTT